MKKKLLLYVLTFWSFTSFCQEKATLTKEETLNYLQKKFTEAVGLTYYEKEDQLTMVKNDISFEGDKIRIHYEVGKLYNAATRTLQPSCNPKYDLIIVVDHLVSPRLLTTTFHEMGKENKVVGYIQCNLSSDGNRYKADIKRCSGYSWNLENWIPQRLSGNFTVHYSKEDPTNFEKVKKALEHLRDLYKAEDDPFGN